MFKVSRDSNKHEPVAYRDMLRTVCCPGRGPDMGMSKSWLYMLRNER